MGTLQLRPEFFDVYLEMAIEFALPLRMGGSSSQARVGFPFRDLAAAEGILFPDHFVMSPIGARANLERVIHDLRPGVTEVYLHPAVNTDELRASHPDWAGRVEDHATLCEDRAFANLLERAGVKRIGYRELRELQRAG
jgi:hypothetical protein